MLEQKSQVRRGKLDNIQQLLFHNKLQQDQGMSGSTSILREAKFPQSNFLSSAGRQGRLVSASSGKHARTGFQARCGSGILRRSSQAAESSKMYSSQTGMSVVLREPAEQIYVQERMPFVFQNEQMSQRIGAINSRAERNLKEAASLNKNTGVLGKAKRILQERSRPVTGKVRSEQSRDRGANPAGGTQELKRVSLKKLESSTGFKVAGNHQDKMVAGYLKQWTMGKAALPTDWFKQVDNGRITNVQNNGLLVGRQLCQTCNRYRCGHLIFSGGVGEQQKLAMRNNESQSNICQSDAPTRQMQLSYTQNTGIEHLQQPKLIEGQMQLSYRKRGDLPSGRGVSRISQRTQIFTKIDQHQQHDLQPSNNVTKRHPKPLSRVASGESSLHLLSFGNLRPKSRIFSATSTSHKSQSFARQRSWVSPHLRYKLEAMKVKEPMKFQINIQQHYPYVNAETIDATAPQPRIIKPKSAKPVAGSAPAPTRIGAPEDARETKQAPRVQNAHDSRISQSADLQDMNEYYYDNIPGQADSVMDTKFPSQGQAAKSAVQMMEEQFKEQRYRTQGMHDAQHAGVSASQGSIPDMLAPQKEPAPRSAENKQAAVIISTNNPQNLYIGDMMQEEIQQRRDKDVQLHDSIQEQQAERLMRLQEASASPSKLLGHSADVKDANWDQLHNIFDQKGVRGSTSLRDGGNSLTNKPAMTNADLNDVNDMDAVLTDFRASGEKSPHINPLHSVSNIPQSKNSMLGGSNEAVVSQMIRAQTQNQHEPDSLADRSVQMGTFQVQITSGMPHGLTLTAGASVMRGNDQQLTNVAGRSANSLTAAGPSRLASKAPKESAERGGHLAPNPLGESATAKKVVPIDDQEKTAVVDGGKAAADCESQSRKNVRLSSVAQRASPSGAVGPADGQPRIIDNVNQYIQMADSPKMYPNDNIISQPKLAASVQSNKSDRNTTKAQSPEMQLQNVENSDYGPDSDLGKSNQRQSAKGLKAKAMLEKRRTEIRVINHKKQRRTSGLRLPINNPMPFAQENASSSNQASQSNQDKTTVYKRDHGQQSAQKLGGGYLMPSRVTDYHDMLPQRVGKPIQSKLNEHLSARRDKNASINLSNESSLIIKNQKIHHRDQVKVARNESNAQVVFDENCNSTGTEEKLQDMVAGDEKTQSKVAAENAVAAPAQRLRQNDVVQPHYNNQDLVGAISSTSSIKVLKIVNIQPSLLDTAMIEKKLQQQRQRMARSPFSNSNKKH